MAQHVTTLNEIRQDTVEQEYALDPNDLLYVCHGSGSERDRVFKIQDVYDGSKEFELLGYGSTSQQIVNAFKAGKIPVIVGGGSSQYTTERMYYFPKRIKDIESGYGVNVNRDCEFYGVGRDATSGHVVLTYLRYWNIPVQGQGEQFTETVVDLDSPTFGSMKLHKENSGNATLEYDGTDLVVDKPISLSGQRSSYKVGLWKIALGNNGTLVLNYNGANKMVLAPNGGVDFKSNSGTDGVDLNTDYWTIEDKANNHPLDVYAGTGNDRERVIRIGQDKSVNVSGSVTVDGIIRSQNAILATSAVDLTSSPYTGYVNGTVITIVNDKEIGEGSISVTLNTNDYDSILSNTARQYIKGTHGWLRYYAGT